jgi:hypothetical protein
MSEKIKRMTAKIRQKRRARMMAPIYAERSRKRIRAKVLRSSRR